MAGVPEAEEDKIEKITKSDLRNTKMPQGSFSVTKVYKKSKMVKIFLSS